MQCISVCVRQQAVCVMNTLWFGPHEAARRALLNVSNSPSPLESKAVKDSDLLKEVLSFLNVKALQHLCTGICSDTAQTFAPKNIMSSSTFVQPQPWYKAEQYNNKPEHYWQPEDSRQIIQVESLQTRFLCFVRGHLYDICQLQGFQNTVFMWMWVQSCAERSSY